MNQENNVMYTLGTVILVLQKTLEMIMIIYMQLHIIKLRYEF